MEPALKQRLIGAAVLVALAMIFLPMLVQGPATESGVSDVPLDMPDTPAGEYETRELPLVTPGEASASGVVGMDARVPADSSSEAVPLPESGAATSASSATPLGNDAGVTAAPLGNDTGVTAAPPSATPVVGAMLPAPTAGGNFAVNFGAFSTVAAADKIVASLRARSCPVIARRPRSTARQCSACASARTPPAPKPRPRACALRRCATISGRRW